MSLSQPIVYALDIATIATSVAAAFFWYRASSHTIHRVTYDEIFDYHDLNRVIVSINRGNVRNRRAALASALSAVLVAIDLTVSHYVV